MLYFTIIKPIVFTLARELFSAIVLLFCLSLFIFHLLSFAPDSKSLQSMANDFQYNSVAEISIIPHQSPPLNYAQWLISCLTGDFGVSNSNGIPVLEQCWEFLGNSCLLIFLSLFFALCLCVPLSLLRTRHRLGGFEKPVTLLINLLSVLPLFWMSYVVIYISVQGFNFFPVYLNQQDLSLGFILLPVLLLALGSGVIVEMLSFLTSEMKRTMNQEYILFARAKGASVAFHAMKEGIIFPLLTLLGNRVAYLFSATVIVEQIFNWPGIGRMLWHAAQERDTPLLMGGVILTALLIRIVHFSARSLYILLNPRASHE